MHMAVLSWWSDLSGFIEPLQDFEDKKRTRSTPMQEMERHSDNKQFRRRRQDGKFADDRALSDEQKFAVAKLAEASSIEH